MKLLLLCLLPVSLLGQTPMLAPDEGPVRSWETENKWQEVTDLDGRFRVLSPGSLTHKVDTVETALGEQQFHTYFFKVPEIQRAENLIYVLSYVDYPEGAIHHDSLELVSELLRSTEESAAEALRGEVIYATDRAVRNYPGRLWRINYKDGEAVARTLAFVVGNRYYELKTFALAGAGLNDSTDRFFDRIEVWAADGEALKKKR